jgi:hypothetical protein
MSTQVKPKAKLINGKLYFRIGLSILTVYVGIAIGFAALTPYQYQRRYQNFLLTSTTVLLQPIMELFANGKVTHFYDYKALPLQDVPVIAPAKIIPSKPMIRNFNNDLQSHFINLFADLGLVQEAAIIAPIDYSGSWSLAFCQDKENSTTVCQVSRIKHRGQVKILVDGNSIIWGLDENGKWVQLQVVKYINRKDRQDILFI